MVPRESDKSISQLQHLTLDAAERLSALEIRMERAEKDLEKVPESMKEFEDRLRIVEKHIWWAVGAIVAIEFLATVGGKLWVGQ